MSVAFSNAGIINPFLDGSTGRNPLAAINALNTMHFGGPASTQEFGNNAYLQGIGVGPNPYGVGGLPPLKRELNGFFMQGNPLLAGQPNQGPASFGPAQSPGYSPSVGLWQPSNFDLATGFQPRGAAQPFANMPVQQFGGAGFPPQQPLSGFGAVPTQFGALPLDPRAIGGSPSFGGSPFGTAYPMMPPPPQMMPPRSPYEQFMQNFWGGAGQFLNRMPQQATASCGGFYQ